MLRSALGVSLGWVGISMLSDGVPALLLPHQLLATGRSNATELGLTTLLAIGLAALVQPFAGAWSDRVGRFRVVAAGAVAALVGLAMLLDPATALAGTVIALCGVGIAQAGYQALLPDRVGVAWRGLAGGLKSAFDVAGAFIGFILLAGLLGAGRVDAAVPLLAVMLVGAFAVSRALLPAPPVLPAPSPMRSDVRLHFGAHRPLLRLILARFLFLLGIYVVGRFLLLFAAERLGLDANAAGEQVGAAFAVLALVTVLASVPSGWLADRLGRRPLMLAGGVLAAIGVALLPSSTSIEAILASGGLMALGSAAFGSASWAMLADVSATPHAGRLLGIAHVGTAGAAAAAGAFGLIIDAAGYEAAFGLAAACSLAGGVLAWRMTDVVRPDGGLIGSMEVAR
ncbi:MAG: MFS transporter [Chloroflexota bacterium]